MPEGFLDFGRAVVLSGRTHQMLRCYTGEPQSSYDDWTGKFGFSVAGGGDANSDGVPDIAVAATNYPAIGPVRDSVSRSRVYVFSGADNDTLMVLTGVGHYAELGFSVAFAGDVNADGHDDLLVGEPQRNAPGYAYGRVYMYSGRDGSILYRLVGDIVLGEFGCSLAILGDLDGDSVSDFVVGAVQASRVYVFSGRTGLELYRLSGEHFHDYFGGAVAAAGDVDRDGCPDFIVGAPRNDFGVFSGRVYVYSGRTGKELRRFTAYHPGDFFGESVADAGDVDRDGYPDILVGATHADTGALNSVGQAYVYSGRSGALMYTFSGRSAADAFGSRSMNVGDLNGDGSAEVAICAVGYDGYDGPYFVYNMGRVYVYSFCPVDIDVLPGQCPNQVTFEPDLRVIRPMAAGARDPYRLTAAIVGSASLNVSTIDPRTVLLEGAAPLRTELRDVTAPPWTKETPCDCAVRGPDGYPDLVLTFDLAAVDKAMHGKSVLSSSEVVNLTAVLKTGEPIIGQDCLRVGLRPIHLAGIPETDTSPATTLSNSPNPFNSATVISYVLDEETHVTLAVFDILGRRVSTLIDDVYPRGAHQVAWDGTDAQGRAVSSGIYLYRLSAGSVVESRKMVLLK